MRWTTKVDHHHVMREGSSFREIYLRTLPPFITLDSVLCLQLKTLQEFNKFVIKIIRDVFPSRRDHW